MTFHSVSVGRVAMFEVKLGLAVSSQLRDLVFWLWTIQPICLEFTKRTATMAKHIVSKPMLLYSKVR